MLYTHVFGIFVVMAQCVHMPLVSEDAASRNRWFRLGTGIGVAYLPWAVVVVTQTLGFLGATSETGVSWIGIVSQYTLRETLLLFAGYPMLYPIVAGGTLNLGTAVIALTVSVLVAPFVAIVYYRTVDIEYVLANIDEAGLLVLGIVVPIAAPFVISLSLLPIYVPRYTVAASLPFFVLLARAIVNVPRRQVQTGLLVVLFLTSGVGLTTYYVSDTEEDWRAATAVIEREAEPADLLVVQPYWVLESVEYYYDGPQLAVTGLERDVVVPQSELSTIVQGYDTVWFVEYQSMASGNLRTLEASHDVREVYSAGSISVYAVEPAPVERPGFTVYGAHGKPVGPTELLR